MGGYMVPRLTEGRRVHHNVNARPSTGIRQLTTVPGACDSEVKKSAECVALAAKWRHNW